MIGSTPQAEMFMLWVYPNTKAGLMTLEKQGRKEEMNPKLLQVVDKYVDVFEIPKELPPKRALDHRIPLIAGTSPVNIRPYRHLPV